MRQICQYYCLSLVAFQSIIHHSVQPGFSGLGELERNTVEKFGVLVLVFLLVVGVVGPSLEVDHLAGKLPSCAFLDRHMDSTVGTEAQNSGGHKVLVSELLES